MSACYLITQYNLNLFGKYTISLNTKTKIAAKNSKLPSVNVFHEYNDI